MRRAWAVVLVWIVSCASSAGEGDAKGTGETPQPTPVGACVPNEIATGNSMHIGAFCTAGGGQCIQWGTGNATICAIDVDPEGEGFCIKLGCKSHDACGEAACCTGRADNPIKACVPIECVSSIGGACPPIPGLDDTPSADGGAMDAGEMEAGATDGGG